MKKQILIIDTHNFPWSMLKNIDYCYPVQILQNERFTKTKIMTLIKRLHLSRKVNRVINLPFKSIWSVALKKLKWENEVQYIVIFSDITIFPISIRFLNKLKRNYNIQYVMYFNDCLESESAYNAKRYLKKIKFDKVLSFDFKDTENNSNFSLYFPPYKKITDAENKELIYDLVWAGNPGIRYDMLMKIYKHLMQNQVRVMYEMRMINVPDDISENESQIKIFSDKRPYSDIIRLNNLSNCILEIPLQGQTGSTYRYYEAVCYNKKLLTTNKYIVNMPFYDQRYMKIIERPEDIDINWLKRRENIDYGYDGRFSPQNFLDGIVKLLETDN